MATTSSVPRLTPEREAEIRKLADKFHLAGNLTANGGQIRAMSDKIQQEAVIADLIAVDNIDYAAFDANQRVAMAVDFAHLPSDVGALLAEIDALRSELSELRNAAGFSLDELLTKYNVALKPIVPHGKPDTNGGAE